MRLEATIRKWVDDSWGIAHSYSRGTNAPEKFFVHKNRLVDGSQVLDAGVRISFEPGLVRRKGDLPAALEIKVVPARTPPAHTSSNDGGVQ